MLKVLLSFSLIQHIIDQQVEKIQLMNCETPSR